MAAWNPEVMHDGLSERKTTRRQERLWLNKIQTCSAYFRMDLAHPEKSCMVNFGNSIPNRYLLLEPISNLNKS